MGKTKIQWSEQTWNPVRGCSRISPGCVNCYAERFEARALPGHLSPTTGEPFAIRKSDGPHWTGKVELIPHMLEIPLKRRIPTTYFVNSMSDLFHENIAARDMDKVFAIMSQCPQHTFQILTKRARIMREYMAAERTPDGIEEAGQSFGWCHANTEGRWPLPNVWLGVSVENQQYADERIPLLLQTPAAVRFLSCEPLLSEISFRWAKWHDYNNTPTSPDGRVHHGHLDGIRGIDWVIVGGESGPGARPFDIDWARSIVRQCGEAGVACFVKQVGSNVIQDGEHRRKADRKGGDMHEWPHDIRVREMPIGVAHG